MFIFIVFFFDFYIVSKLSTNVRHSAVVWFNMLQLHWNFTALLPVLFIDCRKDVSIHY